jgi:hypothetical protein
MFKPMLAYIIQGLSISKDLIPTFKPILAYIQSLLEISDLSVPFNTRIEYKQGF